ncbi:DEAD/DEAH box helicase [Candidatus Micrarchaeota archaeon]|nr:DEAD/DEAH box helicase [Candidatus Micrarchaeota archaeon]
MDTSSRIPLKLENIELRSYQVEAAENVLKKGNTLVIMPTALGKTFIAVLVMAKLLRKSPSSKFLFLAPTKPLAVQQANRIKELLEISGEKVVVVTGETSPEEREGIYGTAQIISATPQTIQNDLLTSKLKLEDFSLLIVDEAHRCVGDYAYAFIAGQARKVPGLLVIGLTASPSSQKEKIQEICDNLGIKNIEIKQEFDRDVKPYVKHIFFDWVFVELPREIVGLREILDEMLKENLVLLKEQGVIESASVQKINKRDLLQLRGKLVASLPATFSSLSVLAKVINLVHGTELLEVEGIEALRGFLKDMETRKVKSKAVKNLLSDFRIKKLAVKCESLLESGVEHPKIRKLKEIVGTEVTEGKSIIVFAHYRNSVRKLVEELNEIAGVDARQLVGRSNEGMSQKEQIQLLEKFRAKEFNVLVASSVGEEGLDIPAVDLVIFYEAVPSEIRAIQRRGRTGRVRSGNVVVLITRDTRDEAYFWISKRKEKKMRQVISEMRGEMGKAVEELPPGQKPLSEFG